MKESGGREIFKKRRRPSLSSLRSSLLAVKKKRGVKKKKNCLVGGSFNTNDFVFERVFFFFFLSSFFFCFSPPSRGTSKRRNDAPVGGGVIHACPRAPGWGEFRARWTGEGEPKRHGGVLVGAHSPSESTFRCFFAFATLVVVLRLSLRSGLPTVDGGRRRVFLDCRGCPAGRQDNWRDVITVAAAFGSRSCAFSSYSFIDNFGIGLATRPRLSLYPRLDARRRVSLNHCSRRGRSRGALPPLRAGVNAVDSLGGKKA